MNVYQRKETIECQDFLNLRLLATLVSAAVTVLLGTTPTAKYFVGSRYSRRLGADKTVASHILSSGCLRLVLASRSSEVKVQRSYRNLDSPSSSCYQQLALLAMRLVSMVSRTKHVTMFAGQLLMSCGDES